MTMQGTAFGVRCGQVWYYNGPLATSRVFAFGDQSMNSSRIHKSSFIVINYYNVVCVIIVS